MSIMTVKRHGEVTSLIALLELLLPYVRSGVGSSVSGVIWTNTVYAEVLKLLLGDAKDMAKKTYEELELQLSHPVGLPVRGAIMQTYGTA